MELFKKKKTKEQLEQERLAEEKAKRDKEYQEKTLVSQTVRELNKAHSKYDVQINSLIQSARDAKKKGLTAQYKMACSGLKIALESQKKLSAMILNITISKQLKDMSANTNDFIKSMSVLSKQLSEVNNEIDHIAVEKDFNEAMMIIAKKDGSLETFMNNIGSSIEDYANSRVDDSIEVDKEIEALIDNEAAESVGRQVDGNIKIGEDVAAGRQVDGNIKIGEDIAAKIKDLERIIND